jgi:hypothetical protein
MLEDIKEALELAFHAPSLVEKMHLNQRVLNDLQIIFILGAGQ